MLRNTLLAAVLLVAAAPPAQAGVVRMVEVETADLRAYLKVIEDGNALMKAKGLPMRLRTLRARFAGDKTGRLVVVVEYASLAELAETDATIKKDPELKAWFESLSKARKVLSDSLYEELQ